MIMNAEEVIPMDFSKYSTLLFDLDGTLIDYAGAQKYAAEYIMEVLNLQESLQYSVAL
jgi:phosphoglycolate phosphatase-like HAD superfamily hydrolase